MYVCMYVCIYIYIYINTDNNMYPTTTTLEVRGGRGRAPAQRRRLPGGIYIYIYV